MCVAGSAHGLAELFAELVNSAVDILKLLVILYLLICDKETVIGDGLYFEVIVKAGDILYFL